MYKIQIKGIKRLESSIRRSPRTVFVELSKAIRTGVGIIRPMMVAETPRGKTRKLSRNIFARSQGLRGEVGPNLAITPYAIFVHQGTRPHIIRPKTKKALYWKGALHPVKLVHHPGTKANPFVERTFEKIKTPVRKIFQGAINRIIADVHR